MSTRKTAGKKIKLISFRTQSAPRWADIRKFGLKKARTRRIRIRTKGWNEGRVKV